MIFRILLVVNFCLLIFVSGSAAQSLSCIQSAFDEEVGNSDEFIEIEKSLCFEIKGNPKLQAIYGFVITKKIGRIVRVYDDGAVFTDYEDLVRYKERKLNGDEIKDIQDQVDTINFKGQALIRRHCVDICSSYEFLKMDRNGGQRISVISPSYPEKLLSGVGKVFEKIAASTNFKSHYYIQDEIKDFEILFADSTLFVNVAWKQDNDFRVLVSDYSRREEIDKATEKYFEDNKIPPDSETYEKILRRLEQYSKIKDTYYSWRSFNGNQLGKIVPGPEVLSYFDPKNSFKTTVYKYYCLCLNDNDCALIKEDESNKLSLIQKGDYPDIVVSDDKRWLVASKKDQKTMWETLVRVNLQTNKFFSVKLKKSEDFDVIAYLSTRKKFLICRHKWIKYDEAPQLIYFLLDADTGKLDEIKGDFDPLLNQDRKLLQPTQKNPNFFWVASHDYKGTTEFGIYDTISFRFKPLAKWSNMEFDSNLMWVDEKGAKIYIAYSGELISLPLPKEANNY